MEFIKCGKNYIIKGSNGRVVSEEEKIKLENRELVLQDLEGCECQKETTKKISKNKKKLKTLEALKDVSPLITKISVNGKEISEVKEYKVTALNNEVQDDTIKKTN